MCNQLKLKHLERKVDLGTHQATGQYVSFSSISRRHDENQVWIGLPPYQESSLTWQL